MTNYIINKDEFRKTVRKLLMETLLSEERETVGDKALLPSSSEGMPVDDVTSVEDVEVVEKKAVESVSEKPSGRDIKAERRLELIAEEAAVDLEEPIISKLKLVDPNDMSPEEQEMYIEVMNVMQEKVTAAVLEAVSQLSSLPKVQED
jgi:hypothetical protein